MKIQLSDYGKDSSCFLGRYQQTIMGFYVAVWFPRPLRIISMLLHILNMNILLNENLQSKSTKYMNVNDRLRFAHSRTSVLSENVFCAVTCMCMERNILHDYLSCIFVNKLFLSYTVRVICPPLNKISWIAWCPLHRECLSLSLNFTSHLWLQEDET